MNLTVLITYLMMTWLAFNWLRLHIRACLNRSGIPVRHIEENHNVPMFVTNIPANQSGQFSGNITVSMRPMTMNQAIQATDITTHYADVHGTPIHIGSPNR